MDETKSEEFFDAHIRILRFHGYWPKEKDGRTTLADVFLRAIMSIGLIGMFCCGFMHIVIKMHLKIKLDADDVMFVTLVVFWICAFFIMHWIHNDLIDFMEELKDFTEFGEPPGLNETVNTQRKIVYAAYFYCQIGGAIYAGLSYVLSSTCKETNAIFANTCGLPIPIYIPFEITQKAKLIIIMVEMVAIVILVFGPGLTISNIFIAVMKNLQLRINHVRELTASMQEARTNDERRSILKICIRYHASVLRFEQLHNKYIGKATIGHLFLISILIAVLWYKIYYDIQVRDMIHLIGWIACMVSLCHSGQGLLDESMKLSTEIYFLSWYDYDPPLQRCIQIFLMKTQKPVKTQAAIFYFFSYGLLVSLANTSYSYMAMLNQFSKRANMTQST